MTRILLILLLLSSLTLCGQGNITWKSDTIINDNGDSTILPEVTFQTIKSAEKYDTLGNLMWRVEMVSRDTVKQTRFYIDGTIKSEDFFKLYKPIDTILDFNWWGGTPFRTLEYCENGNVKSDLLANQPLYKIYSCDSLLLIKADSCNEFLHPVGMYYHYDTEGRTEIKGNFLSDPKGFRCIESGWWEFYEKGILVKKELYEKGKLIEIKNYR